MAKYKAPSRDRKSLEKVEREYIHEYAAKYGDKFINKRDNPLMTIKKVKFKVEMENETQLSAILTNLGIKDVPFSSFIIAALWTTKDTRQCQDITKIQKMKH